MRNYFVHNREFTRDGLLEYCWQRVNDAPEWEKSHLMFILQWLSGEQTFKTTTSGSTGEPKEILMPRSHMESSALITAQFFRLGKSSRVLLALPSSFIAGKMMIVRALVCGWHLEWTEPRSNPLSGPAEAYDFAAFTPMQVATILKEHPERFNNIRKVLIGGGSISEGLERALARCTNEVYASYGMTETITHVALRPLTGEKAGGMFNALPGVRFSTTTDDCLVIEAAHLGGTKIITHDIVQLSSPFTFRFIGRNDNVINSGGIKIFPEKVEEKIAHLLPRPFFITKEWDDILGDKVVMYIEGEPMTDSAQLQLISTMKLYLQPYEIPKTLRFTQAFEYTPTDKIIRKTY